MGTVARLFRCALAICELVTPIRISLAHQHARMCVYVLGRAFHSIHALDVLCLNAKAHKHFHIITGRLLS